MVAAAERRHQGSGVGHRGADPMMGSRVEASRPEAGGLFGSPEGVEASSHSGIEGKNHLRLEDSAPTRGGPPGSGEGGVGSIQAGDTWADRAAAWMEANPEAMSIFMREARKAVRAAEATGRKRIGIKAIAERVRYEFEIERMDAGFKVNNAYVAYIARELIRREPWLAAYIELRKAGDGEEKASGNRQRATGADQDEPREHTEHTEGGRG